MYDELAALLEKQLQEEDDENMDWNDTASRLISVAEEEGQTSRMLVEFEGLFVIYNGQVKILLHLDYSGKE